jgi:outer membrane protein OmpA-like peptidoglycan-associated protein
MKRFLLLLITLASVAVQAQPTRTLSADEIVEQLAAPPRTRSLGQRAFRLEPRKLDFQIGFDFDSARIRSDSVPQLEEIVRAMNADRLASIRFRIEGHTDGVGTAVYNEALSDRRAKAVVEFLQSRGVVTSRLEAEGKGMRELADPANPQAAINRRVRIVTID